MFDTLSNHAIYCVANDVTILISLLMNNNAASLLEVKLNYISLFCDSEFDLLTTLKG